MKKWIFAIAVLLAGCANEENRAVSSVLPAAQETVVPEMTEAVTVHTVGQSAQGQIIKVEERSKWLVAPASVVAQHPKVLVVTSEDQQLEGQVVAYDADYNVAFVHIRNSATVLPQITAYESYDAQGKPLLVPVEVIEEQLPALHAEPLDRVQRAEMYDVFATYAPIQQIQEDVLAEYEKPTFTYNPDTLFAFSEQFYAALNRFLTSGDRAEMTPFIATDSLLETLQTLQQSMSVAFTSYTPQTVQFADHMYHIAGSLTFIEQQEEIESTLTLKVIEQQQQYLIVSMTID